MAAIVTTKRRLVCPGLGDWVEKHEAAHGDGDVVVIEEGQTVTADCPCGESFEGKLVASWDPDDPKAAKA